MNTQWFPDTPAFTHEQKCKKKQCFGLLSGKLIMKVQSRTCRRNKHPENLMWFCSNLEPFDRRRSQRRLYNFIIWSSLPFISLTAADRGRLLHCRVFLCSVMLTAAGEDDYLTPRGHEETGKTGERTWVWIWKQRRTYTSLRAFTWWLTAHVQ